jgi:hypothetical protein
MHGEGGQEGEPPPTSPTTTCTRSAKHYFGEPRQESGSHAVFKTPWQGDPRVNIQNANGQAKPYRVKQVLAAIDKLNQSEEEK